MVENWEAKVSTTVKGKRAGQIWPLFKDFFNLHKWFPSLSTSYGIHGINGQPGCIRHCVGSSIPAAKNSSMNGEEPVSWSKERLIAVDDLNRSLSYEIVESNIGFKSYVSTIRINQIRSDAGQGLDDDDDGCVIEWSFTVDPVEGLRFEDLVRKYEVGLQSMAQRMLDSLRTDY